LANVCFIVHEKPALLSVSLVSTIREKEPEYERSQHVRNQRDSLWEDFGRSGNGKRE
jgi:hypothetical protein